MRKTALENPTLVLVLFFLLVLMGPLGSISATLAQLVMLVSLPFVLRTDGLLAIKREPVFVAYLFAIAALAVAFVLAMQNIVGALHIANFLVVLLAASLFVLARRVEQGKLWQLVASAALAGLLLTFAVALFQTKVQGLPRAEGFAGNANVIARYALLTGFLSLIGMKLFQSPWRFAFLLGPVLGIFICLLSGSRGAFLALPVFMMGAIGLLLFDFAKRFGLFRSGLLLFIGAIVITVLLVLTSDRLSQLGATISSVLAGQSAGEAVDVRLDMYVAGWNAFLAQPFFGYSWQNIVPAANDALSASARTDSLLDYRHLHNDFLNFAVGAGVVGILTLTTFIAAPIAWALLAPADNHNVSARYVLCLLPFAILVFGLTDMSIGYDVITVLYFGLLTLAFASMRSSRTA